MKSRRGGSRHMCEGAKSVDCQMPRRSNVQNGVLLLVHKTTLDECLHAMNVRRKSQCRRDYRQIRNAPAPEGHLLQCRQSP